MRATLLHLVFPLLAVGSLPAQSVISAHAGLVHYLEGNVTLDGDRLHPRFTEFPEVKVGQVLATTRGRAEILLTPGAFLRLAEDSSVRMLSNTLTDTRIQIESGAVLVEVGELLDHNAVTLVANGVTIGLPKRGLYRVQAGEDASGGSVRVYEGQAVLANAATALKLKKGQESDLATITASKFDAKATDPFYRWSARRSGYIASANVSAARVAANSASSSSGYSSGLLGGRSAWSFNPYYGMYTYVPANGISSSPFGSPYYSPGFAAQIYLPRRAPGSSAPANRPLSAAGSPGPRPAGPRAGATRAH